MNAIMRFAFGRPQTAYEANVRAAPRPLTMLAGRVLLAAIFILSGIRKLVEWEATSGYMASEGLPWVPVLLVVAATVEIVGGLSLVTGALARIGALGLIAFLLAATFVFHDFWTLSGPERSAQMAHFLKNTAILGGLLIVIAQGAGWYAVDRRMEPHED